MFEQRVDKTCGIQIVPKRGKSSDETKKEPNGQSRFFMATGGLVDVTDVLTPCKSTHLASSKVHSVLVSFQGVVVNFAGFADVSNVSGVC
jgi:hypothetical protein